MYNIVQYVTCAYVCNGLTVFGMIHKAKIKSISRTLPNWVADTRESGWCPAPLDASWSLPLPASTPCFQLEWQWWARPLVPWWHACRSPESAQETTSTQKLPLFQKCQFSEGFITQHERKAHQELEKTWKDKMFSKQVLKPKLFALTT